jgi:hypothetical protein
MSTHSNSDDDSAVDVPTAAAFQQHSSVVKLLPFWPSKPAAWFANADGQFALRHH